MIAPECAITEKVEPFSRISVLPSYRNPAVVAVGWPALSSL